MRRRIFAYLFIFAALFILFQYVNTKRYVTSTTDKIAKLKAGMEMLKDSVQSLIDENANLTYFSLADNDEALSYFDALDIAQLPHYIADQLLETNENNGDNPLIPYAGMSGPMKINKIKLLNHKWIIADFSDGKHWGELFITYEITTDLNVEFTVVKHLLYGTATP
ncbi:MAG: hydrolase [Bacteroidota bacterium]